MAQQGLTPGSSNKTSCNLWKFENPLGELTPGQRACYYGAKLTRPSLLLRGAFVAGLGQWRNNPEILNQDMDDFAHRFGVFYARRGAQSGAEFLVGYLNHEDPRPHASDLHGFWNRTRAAMLSVLEVTDPNGDTRPAFAPAAGALASGLVSVAGYRQHNSMQDGLMRSGFVYGGDIGTAILREFKPDLSNWASRLRHKRKTD